MGLSAQTVHFGRRGRGPHPCQRVRQREKASLTQRQDTQKGCVFTRSVPVRFLHRIKERGRKRPCFEPQRPAMRGAERVCGLEIRCGLGGRSAPLFGFRWSLRCGMTAVARHFTVSSGAVGKSPPYRMLQKLAFRPEAPIVNSLITLGFSVAFFSPL